MTQYLEINNFVRFFLDYVFYGSKFLKTKEISKKGISFLANVDNVCEPCNKVYSRVLVNATQVYSGPCSSRLDHNSSAANQSFKMHGHDRIKKKSRQKRHFKE